MADHPVPAGPKPITEKERQEITNLAFDLERKIKAAAAKVHESWWDLSQALYEFHDRGYWSALGYESLDEFLAQPELGISRSQFFQMTKLWRDLVVVKQLPAENLKALEPSKVREVAPSIMRGEVKVEDALDDAASLSFRDVKEKYRLEERAKHGQAPDDSTPLDADKEPERRKCDKCGSWFTPTSASQSQPTPQEQEDDI